MSSAQKLNFGCGTRLAAGWTNIDFHSDNKLVRRVNLLNGFPFPDKHFDVVYSSHVLEHFSPDEGEFLIRESYRVLKVGGIIRIVVPDLEGSCREYLKVLDMDDGTHGKDQLYNWIIIELLDQLTRNRPEGQMGPFIRNAETSGDKSFISYIRSRTESVPRQSDKRASFFTRLSRLTPSKVHNKLIYFYLKAVSMLIPKALRSAVLVATPVGEKHRWMYDRHSMHLLFQKVGFSSIQVCSYNLSNIENFNLDLLDSHPSGLPYKNNSLFVEAIKGTC
jgi:SAM-dependent methyltransferase